MRAYALVAGDMGVRLCWCSRSFLSSPQFVAGIQWFSSLFLAFLQTSKRDLILKFFHLLAFCRLYRIQIRGSSGVFEPILKLLKFPVECKNIHQDRLHEIQRVSGVDLPEIGL